MAIATRRARRSTKNISRPSPWSSMQAEPTGPSVAPRSRPEYTKPYTRPAAPLRRGVAHDQVARRAGGADREAAASTNIGTIAASGSDTAQAARAARRRRAGPVAATRVVPRRASRQEAAGDDAGGAAEQIRRDGGRHDRERHAKARVERRGQERLQAHGRGRLSTKKAKHSRIVGWRTARGCRASCVPRASARDAT